MRNVTRTVVGLVAVGFASSAMARLSSEWKQTLDGAAHYVHEPTVAYSKTPQGDKRVKLWTIKNIEPTLERGRTVRSLKSEHTVNCDRRTASSMLYEYEEVYAKGEMVAGPGVVVESSIEPETLQDAIWRKYCKSWKDWFK